MSVRTRISLDGTWQLYIDPQASLCVEDLPGSNPVSVSVPAPWQSQDPALRSYTGVAWYQRTFEVGQPDPENRFILGFGAVDYLAEVWLNGQIAGQHEGGYLPFELDVTSAVRAGQNTLSVRVTDALDIFPEIPHGKQSWYGPVSGIWQSVWLERRPRLHIQSIRITPRALDGCVQISVALSQPLKADQTLHYEVFGPDGMPAAPSFSRQGEAQLYIPDPILWDIGAPNLYTLHVSIPGEQADEVQETFGFREVRTEGGKLLLNGRPIYLRGALDQDYYPDLIYTPPSVGFLEDQFSKALAMGLNCLRTHIKIADPRYYAAADRAGVLIWTELPNWQLLTPDSQKRARETMEGMISRDWNHPSIIIWTVANESWGLDLSNPHHRAWLVEMYETAKIADPHRLIVGNSACWGNFQVVTDLEDFHNYYAIPDHYRKWRRWINNFGSRATWTFAHTYTGYRDWRSFLLNPWKTAVRPPAKETRRTGEEPLLVSEFGNWGLPDVDRLAAAGEPWWFETGFDWADGVVYPHGIENRFQSLHLHRAFPNMEALSQASQRQQFKALRYQIEQIRNQPDVVGYVITEFTDVYWESNGLLDMNRNPKVHFEQLGQLNADDLIIPEAKRLVFWEGEHCSLNVSISHYSRQNLDGSRLEWRLNTHPQVAGVLEDIHPLTAGVTGIGAISFVVPSVSQSKRAVVELRLVDGAGEERAHNELEIFIYPAALRQPLDLTIYSPDLLEPLERLGYHVVDRLADADIAVALRLGDPLREYLLEGGGVVWLAERPNSLQTNMGSLRLRARPGRIWQGDWVSSLSWITQDKLFTSLPLEGLVDFQFADLTPEVLLTGISPTDYAHQVHAGMVVGWLHRPAGLVVERKVGRGMLLACTFRLAGHLSRNPTAAVMLREMLSYLSQAV